MVFTVSVMLVKMKKQRRTNVGGQQKKRLSLYRIGSGPAISVTKLLRRHRTHPNHPLCVQTETFLLLATDVCPSPPTSVLLCSRLLATDVCLCLSFSVPIVGHRHIYKPQSGRCTHNVIRFWSKLTATTASTTAVSTTAIYTKTPPYIGTDGF